MEPETTTPLRAAAIVPAYGNEGTVGEVVARASAHVERVYVVDDGSGDATGQRAREAGAVVLVHPVNRGKGTALLTGMRRALEDGFTHAVCLDADGQHLPEDIPALLEAARQRPEAIVVGVRDLSRAPGASRFGRRFSNFWIRVETGHAVGDSQSGFRVYPLGAVLELGLAGGRYEMEVEVLVRALWAGIPVVDQPCRVHYPVPEERVSAFRPFWDNARISWLNTRLLLSRLFGRTRRRPPRGVPVAGRGPAWGWCLLAAAIRVGGRAAGYPAVAVLAVFYALWAGPERRALLAYLRRRYPRGPRAWRVLANFTLFGWSLVDRLLLLARGPEVFRFEHEDAEEAVEAVASGQGVLLLTAHLGNAELAGAALAARHPGREVALLRYQEPSDPYVAILAGQAGGRAPRVIPVNASEGLAGLEAVRALRAGAIVAVQSDRPVDDRVVEVDLLGGRARLPAGPFLLAALAGVPVIGVACFKVGWSRYRVLATRPRLLRFRGRRHREQDLRRWAEEHARTLERWAERYPLQWFNYIDPWGTDGERTYPAQSSRT